jgi:hypothetical protein
MKARPKLHAALLASALAALALPVAAATVEVTTATTATPDYDYAPSSTDYFVPARPDTDYYYVPPSTSYYVAPGTTYYVPATTVYYEPPIVVTAPPATSDDLITGDVVDSIASDPRISGQVGVDTFNGDVTLNGRVGTPQQAERAASDARSVDGVGDVTNYIRARVGEE